MIEQHAVRAAAETRPGDRSMKVLEYTVSIVAAVAAVLLAFVR